MPLIWPATHFKKHEDEHWLIVLLANSMWGYSTLYYALLWKSAIRVTKPKKVTEEQLAEQYDKVPGLSKEEEQRLLELEERMNVMKSKPATDYDKHMAARFAAYQ